METVKEVIENINASRSQVSACAKDETKVMMAMLNDPTYKVDVYGRNGVEGVYCPYEEARTMVSNIIKDTTKISRNEATELANNYEFDKQNAVIMTGLSKEFINTYIQCGRKLPLGGREDSNISIARKIKAKSGNNLKKVGVNSDGSDKMVETSEVTPAHGSLRVFSPCPSWLK